MNFKLLWKTKAARITIISVAAVLFIGGAYAVFVKTTKNVLPKLKDISVENNILSWGGVKGALGYKVSIDGVLSETAETIFDLSGLLEAKEYHVRVKALGSDNLKSDWSSKITVTRLSAPALAFSNGKLVWENIEGNDGYELYCDEKYLAHLKKDVAEYDLLDVDADCSFQIQAKGDRFHILDSSISEKVSIRKLEAPTGVRVSGAQVSWNASPDADRYYIGGDIAAGEAEKLSYDLRGVKPGEYDISIQAISDRDDICNSDVTTAKIKIEKTPLGALRGVAIKEDRLVWERLENAAGYRILIGQNGKVYKEIVENATGEFADLLELGLADGVYSAEIYAVGDELYADSGKEVVSYNRVTPVIPLPDLAEIESAAIKQGVLKWSGVTGADGYVINIMSGDVNIHNSNVAGNEPFELDIAALGLSPGDYAVMLYALGNERFGNSPAVFIPYTARSLSAPADLKYDGAKLVWGRVEGADYYIVIFGNRPPVTVYGNVYELALDPGEYAISVRTVSDDREVQSSAFAVLNHTVPKRDLGDISDVRIERGVFRWSALANAAGYALNIKDGDGNVLHVYERAVSNDLEVDLYAVGLSLGEYVVLVRAVGNAIYNDSAEVSLGYQDKMIRDAEVRANFNYGNKYPDSGDYWVQHYLNFSLKQGMTLSDLSVPPTEWNAVYTNFLAGEGEVKEQAASAIGEDIMVTYYYKDEVGQNVVLLTTGGAPFVKNKLWGGWLWRYNGSEFAGLQGDIAAPFSIGGIVPAGVMMQVSANIGRKDVISDGTVISSVQLGYIAGGKLYVDVDVIIGGRFYRETAELEVSEI